MNLDVEAPLCQLHNAIALSAASITQGQDQSVMKGDEVIYPIPGLGFFPRNWKLKLPWACWTPLAWNNQQKIKLNLQSNVLLLKI